MHLNQHPGGMGTKPPSHFMAHSECLPAQWKCWEQKCGRNRWDLNHNEENHLGTSKIGSDSHTWSLAITHWVSVGLELQRGEWALPQLQNSKALPHCPQSLLLGRRSLGFHFSSPRPAALNPPCHLMSELCSIKVNCTLFRRDLCRNLPPLLFCEFHEGRPPSSLSWYLCL